MPELTALAWDKALHAAEYAGFALFVCRALRGEEVRSWRRFAITIVGLYAASDEWHQLFVPGRDAAALDWVADAIGCAVGVAAYSSVEAFTGLTPASPYRRPLGPPVPPTERG